MTTATADELGAPPVHEPWAGWGQCLYTGAAGIVLLHAERATCGAGGWDTAHRWVQAMTRGPITANPDAAGLHHGAPAVAFVLGTAGHPAYAAVVDQLDRHVAAIVRRRLDRAHRRLDAGQLPAMAEYDLISGLTGLGAYLLHRHRNGDLLREVLTYLVQLTQPLPADGAILPGWWTADGPDAVRSPAWPGGHANVGMAHGIAGPLALLSAAQLRGVTVSGQAEAIDRVCRWLDGWKVGAGATAWWPGMISAREQRAATLTQPGPQRPSWCYGTPGLARAQQLAGLALNDPGRRRAAEQALAGCLTDPPQLSQVTDASLCHGWAGLLTTAVRVAADSPAPELFAVERVSARMHDHLDQHGTTPDLGLLDGRAGIELAQHTMAAGSPPATGWDACLLLNR